MVRKPGGSSTPPATGAANVPRGAVKGGSSRPSRSFENLWALARTYGTVRAIATGGTLKARGSRTKQKD